MIHQSGGAGGRVGGRHGHSAVSAAGRKLQRERWKVNVLAGRWVASGSLAYSSSHSLSQCDLCHIEINIIVVFKYVERQMRIDGAHLNLSNQVIHLSNQASYVCTCLINLYEAATSLVATPHGHHRSRNSL